MGFLDELRDGKLGVRMAWPGDLRVEKELPAGASILDERFQVRWHVGMSQAAMDMDPAYDALLRADTECFTRGAFETGMPRTEESDWSPVIDFVCFSIGATRALRCVYRTAYSPGNEVVVGDVLVPLPGCTVIVSAGARAGVTGWRESALTMKIGDHVGTQAVAQLAQHEIDDSRHDETFPESPLSRVRRALAWRIDDVGIEVSGPPDHAEAGRTITLPRSGSSVILPPRYRYCRSLSEAMSPTLDAFTRVAPPEVTSRLLDVWRTGAGPISKWFRRRQLKSLALEGLKAWGCLDVSNMDVSPVTFSEYEGRLQIDLQVRFDVAGSPTQSAQRWFCDNSGYPIRVSAGGPPSVPVEDLIADVDQLARSWCPV